MTKDSSFAAFVQDQLRGLGRVACRAMFGGFGLYQGKTFFGVIFKGRLYFKTDEASRAGYVARGMKPFRPSATQTLKTYYEVPVDILEDDELLIAWARRALATATSRAQPGRERARRP